MVAVSRARRGGRRTRTVASIVMFMLAHRMACYTPSLWHLSSPGIIIAIMPTRDGRCTNRTYTETKGRPPQVWRAFLFARNMTLDFGKADGLITAVIQDH